MLNMQVAAGEAYSAAEDHVCNIALALVQSRGESATAFGPGRNNRNTTRDIVVKALGIPERAKAALEACSNSISQGRASWAQQAASACRYTRASTFT